MDQQNLTDRAVKQCIRAGIIRGLTREQIQQLAKRRRKAAERLINGGKR